MNALLRTIPRSGRGRLPFGFTLIELMIVISIVAIIVAAGVPALFRARRLDPLKRAVNDMVAGCSHARAQSILQGVPSEVVIRAEDGQITVPKTVASRRSDADSEFGDSGSDGEGGTGALFEERLNPDVAVELLDVNFRDHMEDSEAHIHFYPNGTSDEFTVVLTYFGGSFKVSLDAVTGLARANRIK